MIEKMVQEQDNRDLIVVKEKPIIKKGVSGHVKWYSLRDNYGFIGRNDDEKDVFVHQSSILKSTIRSRRYRTLADGEPVQFDVVEGRKGFEAINVTGPDGANVRGIPVIIVQDGYARETSFKYASNNGGNNNGRGRNFRNRHSRSGNHNGNSRNRLPSDANKKQGSPDKSINEDVKADNSDTSFEKIESGIAEITVADA